MHTCMCTRFSEYKYKYMYMYMYTYKYMGGKASLMYVEIDV